MSAHRNARAPLSVLSKLSSGPIDLHRATSPLLALAFLVSTWFAGMTAVRIARVERDYQAALEQTRQLGARLDATRALLRDSRLGATDTRIARADSQAQRFHVLAVGMPSGAEQQAQNQAYDARFVDYYVAARREAASVSMSLDADGSSAEDARLGYGMLRENLAAGIHVQEQAIDAARPATAPIELAAWLSIAMLSAAALLRRLAHDRHAQRMAKPTPDYTPIVVGEGPTTISMQDAIERLARKRLATAVAAARVAKRNNERQVEITRNWNMPMFSILPAEPSVAPPIAEMDVYVDEPVQMAPKGRQLKLVTA